jgi:hypothetical protein
MGRPPRRQQTPLRQRTLISSTAARRAEGAGHPATQCASDAPAGTPRWRAAPSTHTDALRARTSSTGSTRSNVL